MLWYNKELFDEADLPYPPTKVGDLYEGKPWDMAAVRDLGMKLTVDKNGNDATSADFDPRQHRAVGLRLPVGRQQPAGRDRDLRRRLRSSPTTARPPRSPTPCATGIKWFNDGVWKDHFIPNQNQVDSDLLAKGNPFQSGNLAMDEIHTWYTCCVNPAAPAKPIVKDFGWAVAPVHNGKTTAKLHADTFSMLKTTKNPDAAFEALSALAGLAASC